MLKDWKVLPSTISGLWVKVEKQSRVRIKDEITSSPREDLFELEHHLCDEFTEFYRAGLGGRGKG